jgi:hypothetical protein
MQRSISNYADSLRNQNISKTDFYKKMYDYIYRWYELKKSSSINAVDTNIREAAVEDLKYLNLVLKDVSKLAS